MSHLTNAQKANLTEQIERGTRLLVFKVFKLMPVL
ncbi:hypothetical protein ACVNP0_13240 [Staphylococcus aureus]